MMASQKDTRKNQKKDEKPGFFKRIKSFFSDIKAELKRVTWPDKKRLKSNASIVIAIILLSVLMIFIFDTVISSLLNALGFYDYDRDRHKGTSTTEITQTVENTETTTSVVVTEPTE